MSLTRILNDPRYRELKNQLKLQFPNPGTPEEKPPLIAQPLTKNCGVVGTAFDYLARFELERHFPSAFTGEWVAESVVNRLTRGKGKNNSGPPRLYAGKLIDSKEFSEIILQEILTAKESYRKFLDDGFLSDELVKKAILMAQLDVIFRAGYHDPKFGIFSPMDVDDLKSLMSIFDHSKFAFQDRLILNPTFGAGSIMVGGADADIIVDDMLIEIKVTKKYSLQRSYLNQLIGYCLLARIGGINGNKSLSPIHRIGIYYARHGELWSMDLSEWGPENHYIEAEKWFQELVAKPYGYSTDEMWALIRGEEIDLEAPGGKKSKKARLKRFLALMKRSKEDAVSNE